MKIKFNMPVELPEKCGVSYSVKTNWRYDGKKIGEFLTLTLDFFSNEFQLDDIVQIFRQISKANPSVIESSLSIPPEHELTFIMTFSKHGASSEQDRDDYSIIHWLPDDPIEWEE